MRNAILMILDNKMQKPCNPAPDETNRLKCRGLQVYTWRKTLHQLCTLSRIGNSASFWKNTSAVWENTNAILKNTASVWNATVHFEPQTVLGAGLVQGLALSMHLSTICKSACYPPLVQGCRVSSHSAYISFDNYE